MPTDWLSETQPGVGSVQCHWGIRQGEAHDCRASTTGQLDMHVATAVPDKSFPMEAKRLEPGSPEAKVALLHHMINMCDGEIRLHAGRWRRYESTDVPTWASYPSQLGKMRRHWNAAHTPEIKDPTLWSSTCTRMRNLRTTGVWNCAPIGPF